MDMEPRDKERLYMSMENFVTSLGNLHILYIRNLKYAHLTPVFRLHNIHLVFSTLNKGI